MELISRLLLVLVKGITLLIGIAMLIGGGLCSASIPFLKFPKDTLILTWVILLAVAVVGLLIFLTIKLSFSEQIKYLVLLMSGLFLVGGGLCSTNSSPQQLNGLLLIDIAVTLCGYILVRWIFTKKQKFPP